MAEGRGATGAGRTIAMVLSGGIALGAYHAGACAALHEEGGGDLRLDWLTGGSIGAVTAAIVAGNPPGRRVERLRRFWDAAAAGLAPPGPSWHGGLGPDAPWRRTQGWASALQAHLLGRPGLFRPRLFAAAAAARASGRSTCWPPARCCAKACPRLGSDAGWPRPGSSPWGVTAPAIGGALAGVDHRRQEM